MYLWALISPVCMQWRMKSSSFFCDFAKSSNCSRYLILKHTYYFKQLIPKSLTQNDMFALEMIWQEKKGVANKMSQQQIFYSIEWIRWETFAYGVQTTFHILRVIWMWKSFDSFLGNKETCANGNANAPSKIVSFIMMENGNMSEMVVVRSRIIQYIWAINWNVDIQFRSNRREQVKDFDQYVISRWEFLTNAHWHRYSHNKMCLRREFTCCSMVNKSNNNNFGGVA